MEIRALLAGAEFPVNTSVTGNQFFSEYSHHSVAADAAGNFVVVWQSQYSFDADVFARRFNNQGVPLGNEFRVNSHVPSGQENPAIAMADDGRFAIVWERAQVSNSGRDIVVRQFDASGQPLANEFIVNTTIAGSQVRPDIAMDDEGNFMATWTDTSASAQGGIYAQRFDWQATQIGGELQISDSEADYSAVALGLDGDFIVAWNEYTGSAQNDFDVRARVFDSAGQPVGATITPHAPSQLPQREPSVAINDAGSFVLTWIDQSSGSGHVIARHYSPAGVALGGEIPVYSATYSRFASVLALPDQSFLIAWDAESEGPGRTVFARVLKSSGVLEQMFQASAIAGGYAFVPSAAVDALGNVVFAWDRQGPGTNGTDIYARQFAAAEIIPPIATSLELRANVVFEGEQINSPTTKHYIASDAVGNFVVVWASQVDDMQQRRVSVRRFDAHGVPLSDEFWLGESDEPGLFGVSVDMNPTGEFAIAWSARTGQSGYQLFIQQFDATGSEIGGRIQVPGEDDKRSPQIVLDDAGNFILVWEQAGSNLLFGQRYSKTGQSLGAVIDISQGVAGAYRPSLAQSSTGEFVVSWTVVQGTNRDVFARRFGAQGQPLSDRFLVHAPSAGNESDSSVVIGPNGEFVVSWMGTPNERGVYARRYNGSGLAQGPEFRVDSSGDSAYPNVAMGTDGSFLVAYSSFPIPFDHSVRNVFARAFDSAGKGGSEFRVNQRLRADNFFPAAIVAPDGGATFAWFGTGSSDVGGDVFIRQFAAGDLQPNVESRLVFYNQSVHDGNSAQIGTADDSAIASDKQALLPGQTATFTNYTSYNRGINGMMIDVVGLPGIPTAGDFTFKIGAQSDPSVWTNAPAPQSVNVRQGAGANGSDRITVIWPDGAIRNQWLQVILWPSQRTGLQQPDVFYFGNAVGESGNEPQSARVSILDELLARNNGTTGTTPVPVTNRFDYNRDGRVSVVDQILARNNITTAATALQLIAPPLELPLMLDSSVFVDGGPIPLYYTADGQNVSPPLRWLGAPVGTREFALIMDDPDAPTAEPFVHWVIYKIPATLGALPENIFKVLAPATPSGVLQGRGSSNAVGYRGPSPPAGPVHHYHFKLYALDTELPVSSGLTKAQLLAAMNGHILASDELIGTYQR